MPQGQATLVGITLDPVGAEISPVELLLCLQGNVLIHYGAYLSKCGWYSILNCEQIDSQRGHTTFYKCQITATKNKK